METPMSVIAKLKAQAERLCGENDALRQENATLREQLNWMDEIVKRVKAQATSRAGRMPK